MERDVLVLNERVWYILSLSLSIDLLQLLNYM